MEIALADKKKPCLAKLPTFATVGWFKKEKKEANGQTNGQQRAQRVKSFCTK